MLVQIPLFDFRRDNYIPFDSSVPIVVNFSGGKDSLALLLWIKAHYPANPVTALYNDTGFEHPGLLEYIQGVTSQLEIPLVVLTAPIDLLSLVRRHGQLPGFGCRWCTSTLKMEPAAKWIRQTFPRQNVVLCFGFRAEESPARAKKRVFVCHDKLSTRKREVFVFAPLLDWTISHVVDFVQAQGFSLFPTYEYLSRLSCRFCFLAGRRDRDAARLHDPSGFELVQACFDDVGLTL